MVDKNYKKFENELEIIYKNWDCNENYHEDERGGFYEESYIYRHISNAFDSFTNWSINLGNHHFGITINAPVALIESWENISHYDYDKTDLEGYEWIPREIKDLILEEFHTTSYIFIVVERNKKGMMHIHILVGIRNFIDYN